MTTYIIEAGSAPGLANLANFATGNTATSFSAPGIGAGTYYVRVRAQNAGGISAASNESTLIVGAVACTSAPNAPTNLAITATGSTVSLAWTAPSGSCSATGYVLQAGSSAGQSDLANAAIGNSTSYVATGVGAGTYYVRVRAANSNGQSGASNEVILTVGGGAVDVTARWIGVAPDGVSFQNVPAAPDTFCDTADDLQLDVTQTGATLTGTVTLRVRSARTPPACSGETVGNQTYTLTEGTVSGTAVSFKIGSVTHFILFQGSVSGNRMSGVVSLRDGGQGPFAATRQR